MIKKDKALNIVLGAVMKWNEEEGVWTFPPIIEEYPGKLVMGEIRAEAAAEIHESAPLMLVTGGSDIHPKTGEKCSRAEELRKRIIYYGVPEEKVFTIGKALKERSNTLGNVQDIVDYLTKNRDILRESRQIGILAPLFQIKRAKIMFTINPYFVKENIDLDWIVAENVLCRNNKRRWQEFIDLYKTPQAQINREMEDKGIEDILNGSYKPKI